MTAAVSANSPSSSSLSSRSLDEIMAKAKRAHALLANRTDHTLAVPDDAPEWLRAMAANPSLEYKNIRSILDVDNHLIYDSLFAHQKVAEFYYFVERPSSSDPADTTTTSSASPSYPHIHAVFHLGRRVCGHHGIVHGGLVASLMDEVSGACAFLSVGPGAFTANLNINYTKPVPARTHVIVKAQVTSVDRRKTTISVTVVNAADEKEAFANGTALFVLPKWLSADTKGEAKADAKETTSGASRSSGDASSAAAPASTDSTTPPASPETKKQKTTDS